MRNGKLRKYITIYEKPKKNIVFFVDVQKPETKFKNK